MGSPPAAARHLHRAPQPLDEHVVDPEPFAVHADGDAVFFQDVGEVGVGELCALIGIEDLGAAEAQQGFCQRLHAEVRRHRGAPRGSVPMQVHGSSSITSGPVQKNEATSTCCVCPGSYPLVGSGTMARLEAEVP
jgi:hypothetical protein